MRIQEIAKVLNKAGLKKANTKRVDFETVQTGHYEARKFNFNGIHSYILPVNGTTCETIMKALEELNLNTYEKSGYVVIAE